jgi:hypothetical protein
MRTERCFQLSAVALATLWSVQPALANFQKQGAYWATSNPSTYAYEPTAIDQPNGRYLYYCGGNTNVAGSGDNIYLWQGGSADPVVVHQSTAAGASDFKHACAPSIIKNPNYGMYNLYYECAPRIIGSYNGQMTGLADGFTQICMAYSWDGVNFIKYSNSSNPYGSVNDQNASAIPVASPQNTFYQCKVQYWAGQGMFVDTSAAPECAFRNNNGILTMDLTAHYGTGHPSVFYNPNDGWIYLFYYDSRGGGIPADRGMWYMKTYDGVHFTAPVFANFPYAMQVRYSPQIGRVVGVTNVGGNTYYNTSNDAYGNSWSWSWTWSSNPPPPPPNAFLVGFWAQTVQGTPTLVSDVNGYLTSLSSVTIIQAESWSGVNHANLVVGTGYFY